jgi:prepilin-type N-terminal cleavage/methylation domain-containing protein
MGQPITRPSRGRRAFVLLEVMVAIVIIGVAMVALLRGFIVSLDQVKKIRLNEQAILLAKSVMDDLVLELPPEGRHEGSFARDPRFREHFEGWHWRIEVEAREPRYSERPRGSMFQELEHVYYVHLQILKDEGESRTARTVRYIDIYTILLEPDIFSSGALQQNQLF